MNGYEPRYQISPTKATLFLGTRRVQLLGFDMLGQVCARPNELMNGLYMVGLTLSSPPPLVWSRGLVKYRKLALKELTGLKYYTAFPSGIVFRP